jgi:2-oxo-4-hydroxy-4-carboxy--5-ureidoimidazoline (OHCU) decarboxylase
MLEFLSVYLAGIGTAALLGHLARRKASREQMQRTDLSEAMHRRVLAASDAAQDLLLGAHPIGVGHRIALDAYRADRDRAAAAYYAALRGEQ